MKSTKVLLQMTSEIIDEFQKCKVTLEDCGEGESLDRNWIKIIEKVYPIVREQVELDN